MSGSSKRTQLSGALALLAVVTVIAVLLGMYQKAFTRTVDLTVVAERAGLQLDPGSPVRASGVTIGEVRDVKIVGDRVEISVALARSSAHLVPEDTKASIRATTVFGAKYVDLGVESATSDKPVASGTVLTATDTTIEANDVFHHALTLLDAIDPQQLNSTLTAVSTAVDGRGDELGQMISAGDGYLREIEPYLGQLETDLDLTGRVTRNYDEVADQAIDVATNLAKTSRTLVRNQDELRQFLRSLRPAAIAVGDAIDDFSEPLSRMTNSLLGVSRLAKEYAPQVECTLRMLYLHATRIPLVVDNLQPSIEMSTGFLPGQDPYQYPENLPKLVTGTGPACYEVSGKDYFQHIQFDDGTHDTYDPSSVAVDVNKTPIQLYDGLIADFFGDSGPALLLNDLAGLGSREGAEQ